MAEAWRETTTHGSVSSQGSAIGVDARVAQLAATQHVVFSLGQLNDAGLSVAAVLQRARAGRLHRIYRGVYSLVPEHMLTREGRRMAAVLACGSGAVLSHRTAAAAHRLLATARATIDVTIPNASHRRHPGIDIHRSATLTAADTTLVDGIPCTTVARTLHDLAAVDRPRRVERALDQAAVLELLDVRALDDQCARNHTSMGAARLRLVLARHDPGATVTWSELEEDFLALTRPAGLPDPEVNVFIVLDDGEPAIRADFHWPARRFVVETDGWDTHKTRSSFERDRRNDLRLNAAGWRVVRTTWRAIHEEAATVAARITAVYASC
jgi:predicted transcriptional regulator of viral defense system